MVRVVSGDFEDNWTTQVRKGVIELCVLNALSKGRLYGYDIVRRLRELDGLFISEGSVYPLLSRLKREALVPSALEGSPDAPGRSGARRRRVAAFETEQLQDVRRPVCVHPSWKSCRGSVSDAGHPCRCQ